MCLWKKKTLPSIQIAGFSAMFSFWLAPHVPPCTEHGHTVISRDWRKLWQNSLSRTLPVGYKWVKILLALPAICRWTTDMSHMTAALPQPEVLMSKDWSTPNKQARNSNTDKWEANQLRTHTSCFSVLKPISSILLFSYNMHWYEIRNFR